MERPSHLRLAQVPELRRPIVVAAFGGWNDAGQAATFALTTMLRSWEATQFGSIDPEEFFDFTEARPNVYVTPLGKRRLSWPANRFYAQRLPQADHDLVLLVGTEPHLKWRTFCDAILQLADTLQAQTLITLGALLADIPHSAEPSVSGSAQGELPERIRALGMEGSAYEGPTGIVGVLNERWLRSGRSAVSLWASAPHYISAGPNPQVALALLRRLSTLLALELPTGVLETEAESFRQRIDEALLENPEALEYVRQLEEQYGTQTPPVASHELLRDLEEFLRSRRPPDDDET